jgi:predicted RNase H-like nuclease (RuvC/YqgF family)
MKKSKIPPEKIILPTDSYTAPFIDEEPNFFYPAEPSTTPKTESLLQRDHSQSKSIEKSKKKPIQSCDELKDKVSRLTHRISSLEAENKTLRYEVDCLITKLTKTEEEKGNPISSSVAVVGCLCTVGTLGLEWRKNNKTRAKKSQA